MAQPRKKAARSPWVLLVAVLLLSSYVRLPREFSGRVIVLIAMLLLMRWCAKVLVRGVTPKRDQQAGK